jgi:hypothetical protein
MDIKDLADEILKAIPENGKSFHRGDLYHKLKESGIETDGYMNAIRQMIDHGYVREMDNYLNYPLTGEGEEFKRNGGYAHLRRAEQEKRITEADDRELSRLVSESTMAVNSSIIEINKSIERTNQSVTATNVSVRNLNDKTEGVYSFQKITTGLTIFVAVMALAVAAFPLFKTPSPRIDTQPIERELHSLKISLDSLRVHQKPAFYQDSAPIKPH